MKKIFLIFIICWGAGCGSTQNPEDFSLSFSENEGKAGYVQLSISGGLASKLSEAATITEYKIILEPMDGGAAEERHLTSQAKGVLIEGLDPKKTYRVRVQALNSRGQILREGIVEGVMALKGKIRNVEAVLKPIPVVLNYLEGEIVSNERLFFHILSDPNHKITIESPDFLADQFSETQEIVTASNGFGKFYPNIFPPGPTIFTVRDLDAGTMYRLTLHLWDGEGIQSAPFFSASAMAPSRFGQVFIRESADAARGGEFFPNIARVLWEGP